MCHRRMGIVLLAFLFFPAASARAALIQSGFNDVSGIHGDGIANNSPYNVGGASLNGQGGAEPGWAGPWVVTTGAVTVGGTAFEGDGAAVFNQNTAEVIRVLSQPLTGRFAVELRVMVQGGITRSVIFRLRDSSLRDAESVGVQWNVAPNGTFFVLDGIEDSCDTDHCPLEDTGLSLTPGVWNLARVEVDFTARTWELFVNGTRYDAPDPLGFRGRPTRLDTVNYLHEIAAPSASFIDAVTIDTDLNGGIVPEPSSLALAGVGLFGVLAYRIKSRVRRAQR